MRSIGAIVDVSTTAERLVRARRPGQAAGMFVRRLTVALIAVLAAVGGLTAPAQAEPTPRRLTGTVSGSPFVVEVPAKWNGTLMLWSHWYDLPGSPQTPPESDPDHPELKTWLLANGYAVAGTQYPMIPFASKEIVDDQLALLDWFTANVGRPKRTIAWGKSLGGQVTAVLAERHPDRISAALPMCGKVAGEVAADNAQLDVAFTMKTLLWPDQPLQLVHIADPDANVALANGLLRSSLDTAAGRARLALASAVGDIPGWADSLNPRPTDPDEQVIHQYLYARYQIGASLFGYARAQAEQLLGGNPSWNLGVDYAAQLAKSSQRAEVTELYNRAGLDLNADLATLAAAPRIAPDARAARRLARDTTLFGLVSVPTMTLHNTGDGTDIVEAEGWYGDAARRLGRGENLRQSYVDRANHCFFTAAEELAALRALVTRLDTGRWGDTGAAALNAVANSYGPEYRQMWSYYSEGAAVVEGAFQPTTFGRLPRPFPF
jgi:pimeloyl-ACP methyl ester carboxylesterase